MLANCKLKRVLCINFVLHLDKEEYVGGVIGDIILENNM